MTDRERALEKAREILPYNVTIQRRESLRQVIAAALFEAEARGKADGIEECAAIVNDIYDAYECPRISNGMLKRAAELRAQMSELKRRAEGGEGWVE